MNLKIGDKVIIIKEKDFTDIYKDFYNQELIILDIIENQHGLLELIKFKSIVTKQQNKGHISWFKKSPQIGDSVKILNHGIVGDNDANFTNRIGIIQDVSYLDKFPYRVLIDNFWDVFVQEIEVPICELRTEDLTEQLSLSDYAKYSVGEINNNYVNEIMSTHYNNIKDLNTTIDEESIINWNKQKNKTLEINTDAQNKIEKNLKKLEDLENESLLNEMVNHPNHYKSNKIEVIDIIDEFNLGFDLGNIIKYILRSEKKGKQLEDLQKALWYLTHKIKKLKNEH